MDDNVSVNALCWFALDLNDESDDDDDDSDDEGGTCIWLSISSYLVS